ncbi:MAG: hypothetical protein SCK28_06850 [Bacillota bacterium]|nr:hypothetical protein [Bacillota bacterium]
MGVGFAILGVTSYALPVRFRVRGQFVECGVPTWSGVGDLLEKAEKITLVAVQNYGTNLRWLFLKGAGTVVKDPDWEGIVSPQGGRVDPGDLYQLLRIEPKRMELFDEQLGWGFRETADF